jgi:hypothetical protein
LTTAENKGEFEAREPLEVPGLDRDHDHLGLRVPAPAAAHARGGHHDLIASVGEVSVLAITPVLEAVRLVLEV